MKQFAKRVKYAFGSMKMARKLSLLLTVVVILSLSVVVALDWSIYDRDMEQTTEALFEQISIQIETVMDTVINNLDAVAKAPLYSTQMQDELRNGEILSEESVARIWQAVEIFSSADRLRHVIAIYNRDGHVAYSGATIKTSYLSKRYYEMWYENAKTGAGSICITGFPEEEETFCCTASRIIKSVPRMDEVGMISISVPRSVFDEACAQLENISGGVAVLLDSEGEVIYTSEAEKSDEHIHAFLDAAQQNDSGRVNAGEFLGYLADSYADKYTVLVYTEKSELMAKQIQVHKLMLLIAALVCTMTILVVVAVVRNTTRPLHRISELMVRVQDGDWSVRFHARYRDEVGILGRNFNHMLDNMNKMTEQLIAVNTSKKQAEIDALQGQINPHFMYNTLEFFRMMAVEKDDFELADLICSFGKMLRYNITTMNEITTIAKELEYLTHYIRIYNARHTRKIELINDVPAELMEYPIIKLLLQPIVENAALHGFELASACDGVIKIRVWREEAYCMIDIGDNGLGMSEERLKYLREMIRMRYADSTEASHIGLRNVNERIKLYYGEDYGLSVDSEENIGTSVHITLPYREEGEIQCGIS